MLGEHTDMKLSIHRTIGKPKKEDIPAYIALGNNWINDDLPWPAVFELITEDGYATSAYLTNDHRAEANFVSRQLLMVDIDEGMTIPELFLDSFYEDYGAGFYATASYTHENPKFRIMFIAENAIIDAQTYKKITRSLMRIYNHADPACKDAARLFFGTPNCIIKEIRNNILPTPMIQLLIELDDATQKQFKTLACPVPTKPDPREERIIELLCSSPIEDYNIWRTIGWGLKAGGFTIEDFKIVTAHSKKDRSMAETIKLWSDGKVGYPGAVTLGSVIKYLKNKFGPNCFIKIKQEKY